MSEMRLALDIDGTIAGDPGFFASLVQDVIWVGGEVQFVQAHNFQMTTVSFPAI